MSDVDFSLINFQSTVVNNDKKRFFSTPGCVNANMKNRLVDVLGQYYCAFFSLPSTQIYFTILSFHSSFFISLAESYKLIHIHTPKKRRTVLRGERVRIKKKYKHAYFFLFGGKHDIELLSLPIPFITFFHSLARCAFFRCCYFFLMVFS